MTSLRPSDESNNSKPNQSIRVLLAGSWPPDPGISSYVHSLARALAQSVSVRVLTFRHMYPTFLYPSGPPPKDNTFPPDPPGIQVDRVLRWYWPPGWIVRALLTPADILHVQFWSVPLAPVWWVLMLLFWMRGRPRVLTVHNLAGHESKKLYGWVTSRLISLASAVITHLEHPPQWFIDECQRRTGQPPLFVPHGPLDLYRQVERSPAQPILPPGAVGVLFFGAIRPYKGLDHLIEAFDAVHQAISSAWLVIAGRPWEPWQRYQTLIDQKPWCQQVITRLDYIPTDEVAGYFNACQLVVAPYLEFDSQSGAALSAIGMEKPLIVTRVGGLPELQPLAEYVVPPADSNALASAIIRALQKPRELARLSAAARFVARESSWTLIQEKTEMIYRTLLPSEKPKP